MEVITVVVGAVVVAVVGLIAERLLKKPAATSNVAVHVTSPSTPSTQVVSSAKLVKVVAGIPVDLDQPETTTPSQLEIIHDAQAKIAAWLAPKPDWTKVTAAELTVLYQQDIATAGVTTFLDYANGAVSTLPVNSTPSPNFVAQGAFLRGEKTTESQRAFVGYNGTDVTTQDEIVWHFDVDVNGIATPR